MWRCTYGLLLIGEVVAANRNSVASNSNGGDACGSSSARWGATEGAPG